MPCRRMASAAMYFTTHEISRFWSSLGAGRAAAPTLITRPFARPMASEEALLDILKVWADAARRGQAGAADIEKIDRGALPEPGDARLDACIERLERTWPKDWYAYVNDVHKYGGDLWERAVEILLPAIRTHGGLQAGGFKMELFFGRYGATPTGIHLDTSDNLAFIVRGPKRLAFWPRDRFQALLQLPNAHAPEQEQALTRRYEDHLHDAIVLDAGAGDVVYWPKEYWHVGASPDGWTAMITIPGQKQFPYMCSSCSCARSGDRPRRRGRADAGDVEPAVRRRRDGSVDVRRRRGAADGRGGGGVLRTRQAGDERRSDGRAQTGVGLASPAPSCARIAARVRGGA